ncbi:MAG: GIY-YIG nuclease family protein [Anaerolineae bacterium]
MIPRAPGVYLLLLSLPARVEAQVGRLRRIDFAPGLYGYAGSALGPGGLAARLKRHASGAGRPHWHIDYLLPHAHLLGALAREHPRRLECVWASWAGQQVQVCIRSFGSSDCACPGHLFFFGLEVDQVRLIELAQHDLAARWFPVDAL